MDNMSVTYSDPLKISSELIRVEKSLQRLYRGGRGMPVDMSQASGALSHGDPYRSGSEVLL